MNIRDHIIYMRDGEGSFSMPLALALVPPNLAHPFVKKLYVEGKSTLCLELSLTLLYVQVNMTKIYTNCGNQNEMPEVLLQSPKSLSSLVCRFFVVFFVLEIFSLI